MDKTNIIKFVNNLPKDLFVAFHEAINNRAKEEFVSFWIDPLQATLEEKVMVSNSEVIKCIKSMRARIPGLSLYDAKQAYDRWRKIVEDARQS